MVQQFGLWVNRRSPGLARILGGAALLLVGVAAGLATAHYGLVGVLGLLAGLAPAVAGFFSPWTGLLLAMAIVFLLPFGVLPVQLGLTPSLLELTLLGTLLGWALPPLLRAERRWRFQMLDVLAWAFVALTFLSLLLGLGRGVNATALHNYGKTLLGMLAFFGIRQLRPTDRQRRRFVSWLLLMAGLASLLGLVLHALPDRPALDILTGLGPLGYPTTGRVLRYVEDDPHGLERAIGTSVDPNSFGGALALAAAIALGEVLAGWSSAAPAIGPAPFRRSGREERKHDPGRPARSAHLSLPMPVLLAILALLLACIYLTYSRAALGGFVVAALFLATVRYRRLWWGILALAVAAALLIAGPGAGHPVVERFQQGIAFQDLANRMRLAEYANALAIVQRYPVFGVGFGQAPEIDLSTGVSSLYLTIAERMGLVGLLAFLAFLGTVAVGALRRCCQASGLQPAHLLALLAGLVAALASGLLDHYFFHLEFPHMVALLWMAMGIVAPRRQTT